MIRSDDVPCHSSDVSLELILDDTSLRLSSVAGNWARLMDAGFRHEPAEAEILVVIDGKPHRSRIYLTHGIDPGSQEITFEYIHYAR